MSGQTQLVAKPSHDLNVPLEEDDDIKSKLRQHLEKGLEKEIDFKIDVLPESEHKQLTDQSSYKNPRFLAEEEFLSSRVVLTLEYLRFGKIHRRNPTEVAFRITFQSGIWLNLTEIDISLHLEAIGDHRVGDRIIPPKVQIADATPCGKPIPEPPAPWEPQQTQKEEEDVMDVDREKDSDKFYFRSTRDKFSVRLQSVRNETRDDDDQVPQAIPLYVRLKHVGTFMFRFYIIATYSYDPDLLPDPPQSTSTNPNEANSFRKIYEWSVFFDKDQRPAGLNLWEAAQKDIQEELKDCGIETWDHRDLPLVRLNPKPVKHGEGQASGSGGLGTAVEGTAEASGSGSGAVESNC